MGHQPIWFTIDGDGLVLGAYREGDDLHLIRIEHASGEQSVLAGEPGRNVDIMGMFSEEFAYPPSLITSRRTGHIIGVRWDS